MDKNLMESTSPCHITWEEERAEIAKALVRELDVPARVASEIQNSLNKIILDRLMAE